MSDSNRGERNSSVGDAFGILLAVILVALIVGALAYSQGKEAERRNQAPADYAQAAKQDALRACAGREAAAVFECVYEKVEAGKEQAQAEQDLDAQQGMKFWAAVMAWLTALAVGITAIGVWFVKRTLDATLEAVEDTGRATDAMLEANRITSQVAEAELRPYVFIDRVELIDIKRDDVIVSDEDGREDLQKGYFSATAVIHYKNYGKVPARKIKSFNKSYFGVPWEGRFWRYHARWTDLWLCAPGHERRAFRPIYISPDQRDDFDRGFIHLFLRIRFQYEDDYGRKYSESAAFQMTGDDLETFFLLTGPLDIQGARRRWAQVEPDLLDYEGPANDDDGTE